MLLAAHAALALLATILLALQFLQARRDGARAAVISACLAGALGSGLVLLAAEGGLPNARLFGHVMHWLGWLALLTWAHALLRAHRCGTTSRAGVPLFLVLGASAAGVLALVQNLI